MGTWEKMEIEQLKKREGLCDKKLKVILKTDF